MANANFFYNKKQPSELLHHLDVNHIPEHIAIIMDGNGRWAEKRGMPRVAGHKQGRIFHCKNYQGSSKM